MAHSVFYATAQDRFRPGVWAGEGRAALTRLRKDERAAGGSPAAGHFSCAAKKSNQKKAAPGVAPLVRGVPVLPDSTRRLRNSTWQGTHNVPCHGTRTVLAEYPLSSRAARRATRGKEQMPKARPKASSHDSALFSVPSTKHRSFVFTQSSVLFFPCHCLTTQRRLTQVATGSGFVTQVPTAGLFFCASSCTKLYSAILVSSAVLSVESQE